MGWKCGWLLLAWSLAGASAMAEEPAAQIYKCRGADGSLVFSDEPCGAADDMQQVEIAPAPLPDIADTLPLCASEDGARLDLARLDRATLSALPASQRANVAEALGDYARWGSRAGARWGRGGDGALHLCLPTFADEIVEFVATADGKLIQIRGGLVSYRNDPDTPAALLARCADTYRACMAGPAAAADSCVAQVPTCDTVQPWRGGRNCCPLECKNHYQQRRARGFSGEGAFLAALYGAPSCVPGLNPTDAQ